MSNPVSIVYPNETGARTSYSIPFEYLSKEFVKATVGGASVPLTFTDTYTVQITPAPVGELRIYRETPRGSLVNVYHDGSVLIDDDLNASFWQSLMVADEVADASIVKGEDGHWDAKNLRVTNLSDPVNPSDAVTKGWTEAVGTGFVSQAKAHRDSAATSAGLASGYEASARTHKDTAVTKASEASASATSASGSASTATTKASEAAASAAAAAASASTAGTKASEASASAATATSKASTAISAADTAAGHASSASTSAAAALAAKNAAEAAVVSTKPADQQIFEAASKSTPLDSDLFGLVDSAASWVMKKLTWGNLKATLKSYFDAIYAPISVVSSKQDALGFTPVQQGGGVGQLTNKIKIGWSASGLKATVDTSDLGVIAFTHQIPAAPNYAWGNASLGQAEVGTYAVMSIVGTASVARGGTIAGSSLRYQSVNSNEFTEGSFGTWRNMSAQISSSGTSKSGLFMRIA